MQIHYILLILLSAFCHSFYNFLMHKSGGSRLFLLLMFFIACSIATVLYVASSKSLSISFPIFCIIYSASLFYVLYQIFVSKAYERGEMSRLYPLTVLSPILVTVWASIFLHEHLNFGIVSGVVISTLGAVVMKQTTMKLADFKQLFSKQNAYKGAGFALLASLFYSVGSVLDKSKIGGIDLVPYLWILLTCMAGNMLILSLIFDGKIFKQYKTINWLQLAIAGVAAYVSFYSFRAALQQIDVSIAVPIRTSSIIFALLFGIIFLKESISANKIIGVITIIAGIFIINISL